MIRITLKASIAVISTLLLIQIEIGWYGLFTNLMLVMLVVLLSFHLGYLEDR